MNETSQTPYASPSADLVDKNSNDKIHNFKRFSAWGVFGLSIITFGFYGVYWIYTRSEVMNSIHDKEIGKPLLMVFIISTILSTVMGFFGDSEIILTIYLVVTLIYFVSYLIALFTLRNRLQDITKTKINPVLTFFASVIYLQYKINECIDSDKPAITA